MKFIVTALLVFIAVSAEPPSPVYNPSYSFIIYQRVQAPYPANRYQALGQHVRVPENQQSPQTVYGPPEDVTTTEVELNSTTEDPAIESTTKPQSRRVTEDKKGRNNKEELVEGAEEGLTGQGVYYIYHPNGVLQKIAYSTANDDQNMAFTAKLKYQNVEPIKEPIYTYDPQTYVLQQIQL